jgi:hypothetical protein
MSSENPYAPPEISEPLTPATPLEKVRAAHATVKWVSTVMVVTASLNLLFSVICSIGFGLEHYDLIPNTRSPFTPIGFAIGASGTLHSLFVIICALRMRVLQNHGWSSLAAFSLAIPCSNMFGIFLFPVGVWALYVLERPHIKAVFYAVKHDNILLRDS